MTATDNFGIRAYAGWCLTAVLGIVPDEDVLAKDKPLKQHQLYYIIRNMNHIYQKKSDSELEGALRSKLRNFFDSTSDIVAVADYLEIGFTFGMKMLDKTLGEGSRFVQENF